MKKKNKMRKSFLAVQYVLFLTTVSFTSLVFAARTARINVEKSSFSSKPGGKVLKKLKKGTPVVASNFETAGHHKVRLSDGTVGWIKTGDLVLGEMPEEFSDGSQEESQPE